MAFQFYFCDASFVGWMVFMLQCGLVMAQHLSLGLSTHWYQLISEVNELFLKYACVLDITYSLPDHSALRKLLHSLQDW